MVSNKLLIDINLSQQEKEIKWDEEQLSFCERYGSFHNSIMAWPGYPNTVTSHKDENNMPLTPLSGLERCIGYDTADSDDRPIGIGLHMFKDERH
jgi:hypothetical protein